MTVFDYLKLLRRGWLLIVALVLLGIGAGQALTAVTTPTYSARATVVVSTLGDATPGALAAANDFSVQRAATYAGLGGTDAVLSRAAAATGGDLDELRRAVSVGVREGTSVIDIDAVGSSPEAVAAQANAVATALGQEAALLDAPSAQSPVRVTQVTQAEVPTVATAPRPRNNVLIGAVVGLALGIGLVVVAHALDTRIRSISDLPSGATLATTTSLPVARTRRSRGAGALDARVEAFRNLRANLQFGARAGSTITVAGVTDGADCHGVARQLATVLGEIGVAVVVVDVDLRPDTRRRGAREERRPAEPGVADVLDGAATAGEVVQRSDDGAGVCTVSAGRVGPSSAQLVGTTAMSSLIAELDSKFDYVILATPSLVDRSESVVAAALAGSSLLVVEAGDTKRSELLYALELLHGVGVTSISLAVDHVRALDLGGTTSGARGGTAS